MNRIVLGSSVSAVVLVAVFWLWPGSHSARLQHELHDAQTTVRRLGQEVEELRTRLAAERARVEANAADLRREKEMNARLHIIVSEGRK